MRLLERLIYHGRGVRTSVVDRRKSCHCTCMLNNLCMVSVPEFWQYKGEVFGVE